MNYRPAFQLKDETKLNGWKWTSWNGLYCSRVEKTAYGKWYWTVLGRWWDGSWGNGWYLRESNCWGDSCEGFIKWPNNSFPESEDIAAVTCREYASCPAYEDSR